MVCLLFASCIGEEEVTSSTTDRVRVGDALPAFSVRLDDGALVTPAALYGHTAVITFFNTGCGDCRRELPVLQQLYEAYAARDVRFVCISRAQPVAEVSAYWQENGLTLPVSSQPDRTVYELFASRGIPRVYVVNPAGRVHALFSERVDAGALRQAIEQAAGSQSDAASRQ